MKGLSVSVEEKAARYDAAIERAKNTIEVNQTIPDIVECVESLFPELAESDDERIRKEILEYFQQFDNKELRGVDISDWIVWLEQGEQKPVISNNALREGITHFGITQYQIDNWLKKYVNVEKQCGQILANSAKTCKDEQKPTEEYNITGIKSKYAQGKLGEMIMNLKSVNEVLEQKPAEKVEPKFKVGDKVKSIIDGFECTIESIDDTCYYGDTTNFDIQDQDGWELVEQKSAWSEEDEKNLLEISCLIGNYRTGDDEYKLDSWLKNLKDRVQPQSHWKPSDEQMEALKYSTYCPNEQMSKVLFELYQDLKKLRDE